MERIGSVTVYFDEDADLSILKDKIIGIIGYGNQGQAWALNLRDSGLNVIVGNIKDKYWDMAVKDGFKVMPISDAVKKADVICLLIPDEIMPEVYKSEIESYLTAGKTLCFASGYNITYGFINPPDYVNVILVAPRMIGKGVRELYKEGRGAPALIAVRDKSKDLELKIALALAKGIGFTRVGAFESSFEEETICDLISEQVMGAITLAALKMSFETAIEAGVRPEIEVLELYVSGEVFEMWKAIFEMGYLEQAKLHSTTSQYGTLTRQEIFSSNEIKDKIKCIVNEIVTGKFAKEWKLEQQAAYPVFSKLKELTAKHPIFKAEKRVRELLKKRGYIKKLRVMWV